MAVQKWDDETFVVTLGDDPALSEDIGEIMARLRGKCCDVVLDLSELGHLTSSGISKLLRLRKHQLDHGRRLILCAPTDRVWSVFLATGLDSIFVVAEAVSDALAHLKSNRRTGD